MHNNEIIVPSEDQNSPLKVILYIFYYLYNIIILLYTLALIGIHF